MKKFLWIVAAAAAVVVLGLLLIPSGSTNFEKPAHVEGAIFGGNSDSNIPVTVRFDPAWITKADPKKYNPDLAQFSVLASADSYFRTKDLDKGTQNRVVFDDASEEYDNTLFLRTVGFEDVRYIESFKIAPQEFDTNDSVTALFGYKNVNDQFDVFAFVFRGTFSSGEWVSAFDAGADTDAYFEMTGDHPEWNDRTQLKGMSVATSRAMDLIHDYITEHDDTKRENRYWVTGHSRGGSLANLTANELEQESSGKVYAYTFSTAPAVLNPRPSSGIFNIYDSSDLFAKLFPFAEEVFGMNGTDKTKAVSGSENILKAIEKLNPDYEYSCVAPEDLEHYMDIFGKRFPSRASLYELFETTQVFDTEEEALERFDTLQSMAGAESGLGIADLYAVSDVEKTDDGKYAVPVQYFSAALLRSMGIGMAYGNQAFSAMEILFQEDPDGLEIIRFLEENGAEMVSSHRLINSYILSGEL